MEGASAVSYTVASVTTRRGLAAVDALLSRCGLRRDPLADYTCGVYDQEDVLCATGSCCGATLRCLAVEDACRGEGLMNLVVSHLCEVQAARGNTRLFLYTKPQSAGFFEDLGFYEVARTDEVAFLENRKTGFADWLSQLHRADVPREQTACVVMNANPFTRGHRYLLETACANAQAVHVFVLSEEYGPISAAVRKRLVALGTADLPKVILHDSGPYIVSAATFPSYFLKQDQQASQVHAQLDLAVFERIARQLNIGARYVGEEPFSQVTALYNRTMAEILPASGVDFRVVPRLRLDGRVISASSVRQALHDGDMAVARAMLCDSVWQYLTGPEGQATLDAIRRTDDLIHH